MKNVISIDPEEFLKNSNGRIFMIVYTCPEGTFFCFGRGNIKNAEHGPMDSPAIDRKELVQEYWAALREIRASKHMGEGTLQIVELPPLTRM